MLTRETLVLREATIGNQIGKKLSKIDENQQQLYDGAINIHQMRIFNTRKSAEITRTPERAETSRVQGNIKKGKPGYGIPFGSLSDEDDDDDAEMQDGQDSNHGSVTLRDATAEATVKEKGIYPLFAPPSEKGRRPKRLRNMLTYRNL